MGELRSSHKAGLLFHQQRESLLNVETQAYTILLIQNISAETQTPVQLKNKLQFSISENGREKYHVGLFNKLDF